MDDQWSYFFSTATDSEVVSSPINEELMVSSASTDSEEVSSPIHEDLMVSSTSTDSQEVSSPIHEDLMVSSTSTDSQEVSSPIHENLMVSSTPEDSSFDRCEDYNLYHFTYKKSADDFLQSIIHPAHPHRLWLGENPDTFCGLCGKAIVDLSYRCMGCRDDFHIDLYCCKYPPPEVIDNPENHCHELTHIKARLEFECEKCGKAGDQFCYGCRECEMISRYEMEFFEMKFHVDCVWQPSEKHPSEIHPSEIKHPLEINYSYHSLHPLKLIMGERLPDYSDGKCRLCGSEVDDKLFYHCSLCNFTLDIRCVLHPPLQSVMDLKAHDHQLTLLPRLDSFTCNACGLKGDRSPYVCFECGFMFHQNCLNFPRVININRHDHRVSRTSVLGVVNSVCGVCRKKVDWTCGGYLCLKCPTYVVHSKCATRDDVWNGRELEGEPEEVEDIEPYVVIDENTIQHFSHKEHYLKLHVNGVIFEENKRCKACIYPVGFQSFYGCCDCDFVLHQNCAEFPKKKRHVLHNHQLTLVPSQGVTYLCNACSTYFSGFMYNPWNGGMTLDVRCASISEPFVHPSHQHPLYHRPEIWNGVIWNGEICNGCNLKEYSVLKCIEDGCEYILGFKCATLPRVIKHRVDDHALSLCYGEDAASGKYWCDICEKETNPKTWFYTCKDHRASLHTTCVVGDFSGLIPGSVVETYRISYEVVPNDSVSRPFCIQCKSHCMHPTMLKVLEISGTSYMDDAVSAMLKVLETSGTSYLNRAILKVLESSDTYICSLHCEYRFRY